MPFEKGNHVKCLATHWDLRPGEAGYSEQLEPFSEKHFNETGDRYLYGEVHSRLKQKQDGHTIYKVKFADSEKLTKCSGMVLS